MNKLVLWILITTTLALLLFVSDTNGLFRRSTRRTPSTRRPPSTRRTPSTRRPPSTRRTPTPPRSTQRVFSQGTTRAAGATVQPSQRSTGHTNQPVTDKAAVPDSTQSSYVVPTISSTQLEQKKKGYFQQWGSDLKKCTIECLQLGAQIGLTVAEFVKFGKEQQLYNERQEADKKEWERRHNLENEEYMRRLELERQTGDDDHPEDNTNQGGAEEYPEEEFIEKYQEDNAVCSNASIALLNEGSPLFVCPLLADSDDEKECCGEPGSQICCAKSDSKPAFIVATDERPSASLASRQLSALTLISFLTITTMGLK